MKHIVFQHEDVAVLQKSIDLDPGMHGEIIEIKDEWAVGPINDIFIPEGIIRRNEWWQMVVGGSGVNAKANGEGVNDQELVSALIRQLKEEESETVWIWAAQNKHDVSGYYWLISQLKEFQGRVFILYLNNLPFINEKGNIFYPVNLFQIPPKEFLKAKKLVRPVSSAEFEVDADEWTKLCNENKGVRILEGGKKLVQYEYDFYDIELKKYITGEWQRAGKIIHQFMHKAEHTTGDVFLLWRLKLILAGDDFDVQGEVKGMKDFEVKKKTAVSFEL